MKPVAIAILLLQAATLLWLWALWQRSDETSRMKLAFQEMTAALHGALNQQRELTLYLEAQRRATSPVSVESAAGSVGEETPASPSQEDPPLPYQQAKDLLDRLRENFVQMRSEKAEDNSFLEPFVKTKEMLVEDLLARGPEALHWVNEEITKRQFDPQFDHHFIEFLLLEVVPRLGNVDLEAAARIARGALVNNAAEQSVRFAGASVLRQLDERSWIVESVAVLRVSGSRAINLRVRLLEMFKDHPTPEIIPVCESFLLERQHPEPLRAKAVEVLSRQSGGPVNSLLRKVLFEDPDPLLKNLALDGLYQRLGTGEDMKQLLKDVVDTDASRMAPLIQEKARKLLEQIAAGAAGPAGQ